MLSLTVLSAMPMSTVTFPAVGIAMLRHIVLKCCMILPVATIVTVIRMICCRVNNRPVYTLLQEQSYPPFRG